MAGLETDAHGEEGGWKTRRSCGSNFVLLAFSEPLIHTKDSRPMAMENIKACLPQES